MIEQEVTGEKMYQLGLLFEIGGFGIEKDAHEALQCHVMASELGHACSKAMIGEYYERGIVAVPKSSLNFDAT